MSEKADNIQLANGIVFQEPYVSQLFRTKEAYNCRNDYILVPTHKVLLMPNKQ